MNQQMRNDKFYWGAATAAFQIEGSPLADGAAASDWYALTHLPDMVENGDTADVACDHYNRWPEDIELMRDLGLNAYRFSIAWPRIFNAAHNINEPGLDFYDRLIDGLLEAEITPFPTIFHWDMPLWLDNEGGWLCPDAPKHYAEYASTLFERFSDRVSHWITLNEPNTYYHSYITEFHWPFHKNAYGELLRCYHNQMLAHQQAVDLYKAQYDGQIGLVMSYRLTRAASASVQDGEAAYRADGVQNRWFLDRVLRGCYPEDIMRFYGDYLPSECRDSLEASSFSKPDFIGLNYYSPDKIWYDEKVELFQFSDSESFELQPMIDADPAGLYEMVSHVDHNYGPIDLYITENGYLDYEPKDGNWDPIQDEGRVAYLEAHLKEVEHCVAAGLPLRGYFHWSLLDNFEWRWGLGRRLGLVYVDRKTQDRRPKASAKFYKEFLAQRGSRVE